MTLHFHESVCITAMKTDKTFGLTEIFKKISVFAVAEQLQTWSSEEERRVDALASGAEERRDKLR